MLICFPQTTTQEDQKSRRRVGPGWCAVRGSSQRSLPSLPRPQAYLPPDTVRLHLEIMPVISCFSTKGLDCLPVFVVSVAFDFRSR